MGSVNVEDCQIERASRLCDADEKADDAAHGLAPNDCRRNNGWSLTDIVGTQGGDPGTRKICALPPSLPSGGVREARQPFRYEDWTRTRNGGFKLKAGAARRMTERATLAAAPSCRTWDFTLQGARLIE
jgi:hypothetical protein